MTLSMAFPRSSVSESTTQALLYWDWDSAPLRRWGLCHMCVINRLYGDCAAQLQRLGHAKAISTAGRCPAGPPHEDPDNLSALQPTGRASKDPSCPTPVSDEHLIQRNCPCLARGPPKP